MGHTPVRFKDRAPGWKRTLGDNRLKALLLFACLFGDREEEPRGFMHAPQVL